MVMFAYKCATPSEPKFTNPLEVLQAIKGLVVSKAVGPNGILSRVLKHLPDFTMTFLLKVFNAVLQRLYFPPTLKHAYVVSILKRGLGGGGGAYAVFFL